MGKFFIGVCAGLAKTIVHATDAFLFGLYASFGVLGFVWGLKIISPVIEFICK